MALHCAYELHFRIKVRRTVPQFLKNGNSLAVHIIAFIAHLYEQKFWNAAFIRYRYFPLHSLIARVVSHRLTDSDHDGWFYVEEKWCTHGCEALKLSKVCISLHQNVV